MAEPLHILMVIDNFHPLVGGAETAVLGSARALAARGHRIDVLTMRKKSEWPPEEQLGPVRVLRFDERVPRRPFGRLLYERANAAAARRFFDERLAADPYRAVLLHPIDAAFGVVRSRAAADSALVYCFHAPLGQEHWLQARGMLRHERRVVPRLAATLAAAHTAHFRARRQRAAIQRCQAVTCPSDYARELLGDMMPSLGPKHVHVIPWGVDADRFCPAPDRQALRAELGWGPGELVLFTARRLVPRMGVGELIRGFGIAAHQRPGLRLVVAGSGPLRGRLEALAARAGGAIDFVGFLPEDELLRYFQAADLFVLPSLDLEAFGMVTVEALACGTPVLGTRRCATPEILTPLDERLLIPRVDAGAVADAILGPGIAVASDPAFARRCRAHVVDHYSWDRTAKAFEALVRHLDHERSRP